MWLCTTTRIVAGHLKSEWNSAERRQAKNFPYYFGLCILLTTLLYTGISAGEQWLAVIGLAPLIIVYQTINFHHYIVDSMIWKVRKPKIKQTLGIDDH